MKCKYCDQEIAEGSTSCPICGKSLTSEGGTDTAATSGTTSSEGTAPEVMSSNAFSSDNALAEAPKNNKKKVGIIAGIAVAAVVVVAGAAMFMPKKNPKDAVIDAFKSIVAEGQTNPMEEIFGWNAMEEKLSKESSQVEMEVELQDISDETLAQASTGKIGVSAYMDVENWKMSYVIGVGYADMNIANMECYLDEKQFIAAIPELSTKAFTLNYADDLEGQIANSPYLGQVLNDSGVDITGFNDYLTKYKEIASAETKLFDVKELWRRYKEGSKAIDDLKAAMTVEKADKKSFTIEGSEQKCTGYRAVITKDALLQFLTTSKEFFLSDETLKKDFVQYISVVKELQGNMFSLYAIQNEEEMTPEQMQEWAWKNVEEQVDLVLEQLKESMGDVTFNVYVTKDGKMASFDYSTTARIMEEDIKLDGTVTFEGGYSMMSNIDAVLNMEDAAGTVITFNFDKNGTYEADKIYTGDWTASMTNGAEEYSLVYKGDYAVDSGAYNISLDVQANGESAGMMTSSGVVNAVKGETFEVQFDSIRLESGMLTGSDEYIDLSGFFKVGPLEGTIEVPQGESFDLLATSEEDWTEVFTEIMGSAYSLMMGFAQ